MALLAGIAGMSPGVAEPVPGPRPILAVRETTQDGGVVEEGSVIRYRFAVTNRGQIDLELTEVRPSCGCALVRWDRRIAPEGGGVIEAELRTAGFRGLVRKHLAVFSNDPERPQLELTLCAQVIPLVQIDPGPVALLSIEEEPASQVFILERTGGHPMKILEVTSTAPYLRTEVRPLPGAGRFQLTVTAMPDTPYGRRPTPVLVRTDLEKTGDLTLTLIVDRGILVTPPRLFLELTAGSGPQAPPAVATLMRQKGSFHVKKITVDDPKLDAGFKTVRAGSEYQVILTSRSRWEAGSVQRTLTITTDDPRQPILNIPVLVVTQRESVEALPHGTPSAAAATR